ncbi:helix-turn-helix transcriptional regulator [Acinetobacter baumannii]|uniref:helix-turn-helix domain-containing protein n=1 Tax=Acinetobacter TaxID=469 RepID=UPI0013D8CB07|nr:MULTISPECIES: helix-turn-helix transcriptional regulator [Acinetobacter]ELZ3581755.1 helix-turn-helix transcriptional regulator [Acinetobacter baumannii]ELZ3585893.1 helix-turn-helix transcriptional regulator [Acinetobacter baumannii]MDD2944982.1 helix-turn-helix transcriptional regulator [Acinetobacter sp.]
MNHDFTVIGQLLALVNYLKQDNVPEIPNLSDLGYIPALLNSVSAADDLTYKEKVIRNRIKQIAKQIDLSTVEILGAEMYHNQQSFSKIVIGYSKERNGLLNGLHLKNYRAQNNWTIIEMAKILNVNVKNIQAWEAHKRNIPENIVKKLN